MIKVTDLAYLRLRAPDLDRMQAFLEEFGMLLAEKTETALYMRGTGTNPVIHVTEKGDPGFIGLAFECAAPEDLERLSGMEGASPIHEANLPGGGSLVHFTDPNGFRVDVVHGAERTKEIVPAKRAPINEVHGYARKGELLRLKEGPSHVKRLGHVVIDVKDFRESERWYKERFGLITSDEIYIGSEENALGAFMRCDKGDDYVDHHTLFTVGTGKPGFNHMAYEVADTDDLHLGHDYLKGKGRDHVWGIGRHILGSQVFDYWRDPWGHKIEHWTDGDLLNASTPPTKQPIDALMATQWGMKAPPAMAE